MSLTRRQMLLAAGAGLLGPAAARAIARPARETKRVLFFTKSSGFQHSVITRKDDEPGLAERILAQIGKDAGFEVVATKDGRMFDPDKIGQWDAFAFYTTGDLTQVGTTDKAPPMSADGKKALLDAIAAGKGFMGMHCATDTFHSHGDRIDPFIKMIGGEFIVHGAQQVAKLFVTDAHFPGAIAFGDVFTINDEWYAQKNLADDLHVIIAHNTEGMSGPMYRRPNFPQTWSRMQEKGRVFYTSMGHREDVWENPKYQGLLVGALKVITGQAEADFTPNIKKVTPQYNQLPQSG
jgi:type 1 glutamine amidotransferase